MTEGKIYYFYASFCISYQKVCFSHDLSQKLERLRDRTESPLFIFNHQFTIDVNYSFLRMKFSRLNMRLHFQYNGHKNTFELN